MDKKTKAFVDYVRNHLKDYGGSLFLGRGKEINTGEGLRSTGSFCDTPLTIRVAKNSKDFLGTLAHEYAHFLQWLEFPKNVLDADDNATTIFFNWLAGEERANREIEKAFSRLTIMERDAERRAVEIIKKFDLDVDVDNYIRKANCYIYMHWIMRERRSWNYRKGVRDPMKSRKLMGMMPNTFKAKSDKRIPERIREALLSYYP